MIELGNIPPQATDFEEAVLGAVLMEADSFDLIASFIHSGMFYKPAHQKVYNAVELLKKDSIPVDLLSIVEKLKQIGELEAVGGPYFISTLTSRVGSAANIEYHARVIQEKFMQRELIRICSDGAKAAFEGQDVFSLYSKVLTDLETASFIKSTDLSAKSRMKDALQFVNDAMNSSTGLAGPSSGYKTIDDITGGLIPGDLIVIGGLPGAFKTAIMLAIMHHVAKQAVPVLMFEQEMSTEQTGLRELSRECGIPVYRLKTGNVSKEEYTLLLQTAGIIENRPVFVDTTSGINVGYIKSIARKYIKEQGVGLIVVDYLQLMDLSDNKNSEQALDIATKQLKIMAKTLKVPVILLSAFNDTAYQDTTKPPSAKALKGSRAIGAHADIVIFLWNPSKDNPGHTYFDGSVEIPTEGKLGIIANKNRMGANGVEWLGVNPETNNFYDLD